MTIIPNQFVYNLGATGIDAILQRVALAVSTLKGSVPFYRDFGISADIPDLPTIAAKPLIISSITQVVREYVPECRIKNITFSGNLDVELEVDIDA